MPETSRTLSVARSRTALLAASLIAASCASPPPAPIIVTYEEKLASILRLEDRRVVRDPAPAPMVVAPSGGSGAQPPPPPPPSLTAMLSDADARIRRRAALAIGRVGLGEGVDPLTALLADPVVDVRQMAAFALGLLKDPASSAALRAALADPSPAVQGRAAEALGFVGDQASGSAIGQMVARYVRDAAALAPDHEAPLEAGAEAFRLGLGALVRLKAYDALAAAVLDASSGQPLAHWWPVAFALERIGEPRAAPALLLLAQTEGRYTRGFAVKGLGTLKEPRAVPVLLSMLALVDREPGLAAEAARALGRIADPRSRADLIRLSVNFKVSPMIRAEAVTALGGIPSEESLNAVLNVVADRSPSVRAAALGALSRQDPQALVTVLSSLDSDPHWSVRAALATAVATADPIIAVPRLREMLADQDQRVVPAVLTALARLKAPNVEQTLIERLRAEDPVVRATAAAQLGELMPPSAVPALIAAYRFGEVDSTYTARAAALGALAKYKDPSAWDAIAAGLADKDWALRLRAAELLRQRDANADVSAMRPAPVSLSGPDYQSPDLVAPRFSPHAYIDTDKGTIQIELAVLDAPLTARNFVALARRGWFNNLAIHRVVPNFVVQDGDPRGDGEGSPGYTIRDELNGRPYLRGTVGMALDWADTGGSQFFITHSPQPHLDARYTVFGHVVSGMDVVDRLDQWDVIRRVRVWDGVQFTGMGETESSRGR